MTGLNRIDIDQIWGRKRKKVTGLIKPKEERLKREGQQINYQRKC